MEADIRWLDDPQVFRVGQLPAHSDHPIYADAEEAAEDKSSLVQSLEGNWEFAYSVNAASRPVDFYRDNAEGAFSEAEYNPVGSYWKRFHLADGLRGKCINAVRRHFWKIRISSASSESSAV